jgi:hypothetical protein
MNLFENILRTDCGPATPTEDTFSFLNRSAWPASEAVRNLLESFFGRYPSSESAELKCKFRAQFESAFFELFLHELLLRLGCEVSYIPISMGQTTKPDFLARFPHSYQFPYFPGSSWTQSVNGVNVLVPGHLLSAPFRNHIVLNTESKEASWKTSSQECISEGGALLTPVSKLPCGWNMRGKADVLLMSDLHIAASAEGGVMTADS